MISTGLLFTSCNKDDDDAGSSLVILNSFGPSPALRGGQLKFIGQNLDQVTSIVLTDNVQVSNFVTKTDELIEIVVPEETVDGFVTLKTSQGDITTKTMLTISEPISIDTITPGQARPGTVIAIEGDYLNLIKEVIFSANVGVGDTAFISHSKEKIEVMVPEKAQTGFVTVSNGEADPILVTFTTELNVTLPAITEFSPNPVKAGTTLTIQGTDLDLTKEIVFGGGNRITDFASQTADKIEVTVPTDAKDGKFRLVVASLVEVEATDDLVMSVPTISGIAPNPVKNGQNITVTGGDLDLVTSISFGGDKVGEVVSQSAAEIVVKVPIDATEAVVNFATAADKSVSSSEVLSLVKPSISGIAPTEIQVTNELSITGEDLDVVASVKFTGDVQADVNSASETEALVTVPVGAATGPITVVMINGDEVTSAESLTVLASTSAVITDMPESAGPGDMISIIGENLDEVTEIIFPVDVPATMYGQKTSTLIEVFIPSNVQTGIGTLILITSDGQMVVSPEINIQGVDPVADPDLVFFNFDNLGLWWNDAGTPENEPSLSLDGTNYFRINQACDGWTGFFWRNGQDNFPAATIGTNINGYVFKFDVNVLEPITGGEFAWRLKGSEGDFWYYWKPWESTGSYQTNGWITITIPLNQFLADGSPIMDMNSINEDFGVAFNNGAATVNACIDNVRFELQ
ncbi:MAG: hypothetical protein DHS20C18_18190 [Saprospiraceae bacterium]|nr:MAG: hypothetical protein DHS20C18_18190 [Saprospiraceae bacterium]